MLAADLLKVKKQTQNLESRGASATMPGYRDGFYAARASFCTGHIELKVSVYVAFPRPNQNVDQAYVQLRRT